MEEGGQGAGENPLPLPSDGQVPALGNFTNAAGQEERAKRRRTMACGRVLRCTRPAAVESRFPAGDRPRS
jgi:hypothetical protein